MPYEQESCGRLHLRLNSGRDQIRAQLHNLVLKGIKRDIIVTPVTRKGFLLVSLTLALSGLTRQGSAELAAGSSGANRIMEQLFQVGTEGKRAASMPMVVADGTGQERVRSMQARSMRGKDVRKSFVLVDSPADVRGVGLLSLDYDDPKQEGERWLCLPNLGRSSRIANGQMSGAFVGSGLSYADMSQPNPKLFQFTLSAVTVGGEDCWLIVGNPVDGKAERQLGYKSLEVWVSKSKLVAVRMRPLSDGKRTKYLRASELRQVGKHWVAQRIEARTVEGEKLVSKTVLTTVSISTVEDAASDEDFTKRRLEQGL